MLTLMLRRDLIRKRTYTWPLIDILLLVSSLHHEMKGSNNERTNERKEGEKW